MSNLTAPHPSDDPDHPPAARRAHPDERPLHVVDARWRGWRSRPALPGEHTTRTRAGGPHLYEPADPGERAAPYDEVWDRVGPLRPVVPPPRAELQALEKALERAGRRALPTLCAALHHLTVDHAYRCAQAPADTEFGDCLTAGNPRSLASEVIQTAARIGSKISPNRLDERALHAVTQIVRGWVEHPARYVEVGANLAYVLGRVIDHAGGYRRVCDQWMLENPASALQGGQLRLWACSMSAHRPVPPAWRTLRLVVAVQPPPCVPQRGRVALIAQTLADSVTDPALFNPRVGYWPMYAELWYLPRAHAVTESDGPVTLVCALHAEQLPGQLADPADDHLVTTANDAMAAGLRTLTPDGEGAGLSLLPMTPDDYAAVQARAAGAFISGGQRPPLTPPPDTLN